MHTRNLSAGRSAASICVAALVAACGGGGDGGGTAGDSMAGGAAAALGSSKSDTTPQLTVPSKVSEPSKTLTLRAFGTQAVGVGPSVTVRINGTVVGSVEVRASEPTDYTLNVPGIKAGDAVDVALTNAAGVNGQWRTLTVHYLTDGNRFVLPTQPGVVFDAGDGTASFDGLDVQSGRSNLRLNGALRLTWPDPAPAPFTSREAESARFLQQATFGPTLTDIHRLNSLSFAQWLEEQIAMPPSGSFVEFVQSKYDQGADFTPPLGRKYSPEWVGQRFWAQAATAPDQLRQRMGFALQQIFVVSQSDANLFWQQRTFAGYVDTLHRLAFGNFRTLLEEVALSPAMGIYLSHMRNMKEEPAANRMPDENFARELMQLFTIGLHELNADGSPRLDASGRPIETYNNADVMALARVFTGWSWGYDDREMTEENFRWGTPKADTKGSLRVDIRRMKPYPSMASTAEKRLFTDKTNALLIPANTSPTESVRMALDALFLHPNVGPFIGRQLIQRLVTANPSPAYVARVTQVFNNNGKGVRGDLAAVTRAILLDDEARGAEPPVGTLREPVLRVTHMMRALGARSSSGEYRLTDETSSLGQRPFYQPSVFNFFRPGYVPPGSFLASQGRVAPEMQIVDEATTANWINRVEVMLQEGMGWVGTQIDVAWPMTTEAGIATTTPVALIERFNLLFMSGRMSFAMRKAMLDAMLGVVDDAVDRDLKRARVAAFIAATSPDFMVQR